MQSYIYVESLVRLDVYKKGGIVRRPKKREGWKLKKWKSWEHELSRQDEMWSHIYQKEHDMTVFSQQTGIQLNHRVQSISDDGIRQQIGIRIDHIVPVFPNKAFDEEIWRIVRMTENAIQYQVGPSSSNDVISSQNHNDGEDTVES
ncbi:hypothetical protein D1007_40790 [Hordeum vulgare]|nr:hypothetical protein D1007_40790 [Hordeum vulgare]